MSSTLKMVSLFFSVVSLTPLVHLKMASPFRLQSFFYSLPFFHQNGRPNPISFSRYANTSLLDFRMIGKSIQLIVLEMLLVTQVFVQRIFAMDWEFLLGIIPSNLNLLITWNVNVTIQRPSCRLVKKESQMLQLKAKLETKKAS